MKKRLAVVLCAAMMLSACGGASTSDKTADTKGQTAADSKADATEGSKGDGKLVLSTYGLSEEFLKMKYILLLSRNLAARS